MMKKNVNFKEEKYGIEKVFMVFIPVCFIMLLFSGCNNRILNQFGMPGSPGDNHEEAEGYKLPEPDDPKDDTAGEGEDDSRELLFYYPHRENGYLIPVTRRIPPAEGIARAVLEGLVESEELKETLDGTDLSPLLPSATEIRGINIEDGLATVNFSASFMNYDEDEERMVLNGVFSSLKQFDTIEKLQVQVEGVSLSDFPGFGTGVFPLGTECRINLEVSDELEDYNDSQIVKIYFCHYSPSGKIFYVPISRAINPAEGFVEASLLELLKGPGPGSKLFTDIPADTRLLSVDVEENLALVDFSQALTGYRGGLTGENNVINQIVLTLTDHPEIETVMILVDGKEITLNGGREPGEKLERPRLLNFLD